MDLKVQVRNPFDHRYPCLNLHAQSSSVSWVQIGQQQQKCLHVWILDLMYNIPRVGKRFIQSIENNKILLLLLFWNEIKREQSRLRPWNQAGFHFFLWMTVVRVDAVSLFSASVSAEGFGLLRKAGWGVLNIFKQFFSTSFFFCCTCHNPLWYFLLL